MTESGLEALGAHEDDNAVPPQQSASQHVGTVDARRWRDKVNDRPIRLAELSDLDIAWPHHSDTLQPSKGDSKAVPIPGGRQSDLLHISGYRLAAKKLATEIQAGPRENESLIYPFAHCWRHHIELQMKTFLHIAAPMVGEPLPGNINQTHSLGRLWALVRLCIPRIFPDDPSADTRIPDRLIGQLVDLDADGATFRYAHTASGDATIKKPTSLAVQKFDASLENLSAYFTGAIEGAAYLSHQMLGSGGW